MRPKPTDPTPWPAPFLALSDVGMCPRCRGVIRVGVQLAAPETRAGGLAFTARQARACECPPRDATGADQERPT